MRYFHPLLLLTLACMSPALAQSSLLESVKRNPKEALSICSQFRALNADGISASSQEAINTIANQKQLNKTDAEILSIYVIGLHCPDVN